MEAAAAAAVQGISHHKEGGGLHFTGLDVQALPGLPFVEQLIGYRHTLGAVLAVERVLALNDAYLGTLAQRPGRLDQRGGDLEVRHRGVLDGGIFPAGMLQADRAGGDHHVTAADIQLDAAAGPYADKRVSADVVQFLHGDGGGGPADTGGADGNLLPQQRTGIDGVLAVLRNKVRVVEQLRDLFTAAGVAGKNNIAAHVAFGAVDMILLFQLLHDISSSIYVQVVMS